MVFQIIQQVLNPAERSCMGLFGAVLKVVDLITTIIMVVSLDGIYSMATGATTSRFVVIARPLSVTPAKAFVVRLRARPATRPLCSRRAPGLPLGQTPLPELCFPTDTPRTHVGAACVARARAAAPPRMPFRQLLLPQP